MLLTRRNKSNLEKTFDSLNNTADPFLLEKGSAAKRFIRRFGYPGSDIKEFSQKVLSQIAREKEILQAVFLMIVTEDHIRKLRFLSGYACINLDTTEHEFLMGEGLPGQVAMEGKILNLKSVPEGYLKIRTGLGEASPNSLIIFPVQTENKILGVIELASFHEFTAEDEEFFLSLSELIAGQMLLFINDSDNSISKLE